ncbi:MAG: YciK family oxidoreductase, partial [Pseudomonadales bacterium]|nr:YciK family oxidoreductase [Pseudomonadales bacterium]
MSFAKDWTASPDLLADRVILVTGASEGIGRCAAKTFAAHGATVIAVARTVPRLESLYDEIVAAGHPEPVIQGVDLAGLTMSDCRQLADASGEAFGRVDGVLHNGGLLGDRVPLDRFDPETWRRVMAANLDACFLLTQAVLPWLEHGTDPRVIFTSSGAGLRPRAYWGAYAVSKAGVEALMRVFADENERVTKTAFATLNPGGTRTRMRTAAVPGEDAMRLPTPEDLMP